MIPVTYGLLWAEATTTSDTVAQVTSRTLGAGAVEREP
jgi:hypothetical protein